MSAVAPCVISATGDADPAPVFRPAHTLTGRQKAAVIVRLLLAEGADVPLLALDDDQQAALTEEIGQMPTIDRDTLQAVVGEFSALLERVGLSFAGGLDGALRMLDGRISASAADRLRRLAAGKGREDCWDRIAALEPDRLLPALQEESVEIAAVILSKLPVPQAADLLGRLAGERARRIAWSISQTGGMDPETVQRIGQSLIGQLATQPVRAFDFDPVDRVGAILNVSPAATRDEVLKGLEEDDGGLAEGVRRVIFTFAHIPARIAARDVPKFLRGVEQETLIKALGGAKGEAAAAAEFILANMSQRMAATLREEIAGAGRIRDRDTEAAQTAVVIAIRELEEAGELVMIRRDEEEGGG